MALKPPNVLLIYPRFDNTSFWNYESTCRLLGKRYPAPPLGLITVAALLPEHWPVRLIDRNVDDLTDADFQWAELVMMGGMLPQQIDMKVLIDQARKHGVTSLVGGPDVSSQPECYEQADMQIIGEAEGAIAEFIAAWERGERSGQYCAPLHTVDIKQTPIPRFELLKFDNYLQLNVQFSRGCPFLCEFCDIIELFGRVPRTKDIAQILAELDRIYELGYRGHVDFVDDNLIGNKKAVKAFLPHLIEWQKARRYPFAFTTEASLNISDDAEFLGLMRDAGFFAVFVGIESPDPDVLIATQKKQNTKRDIAACINVIQSYGMFVAGGFIIGFDDEGDQVDLGLIELIEEASIPISMVGLLYALPNTQLTRRLAREGRLHGREKNPSEDRLLADQCTAGLNFKTRRPRAQILKNFLTVIEHLYDRENYFKRVRRTVELIDASGPSGAIHPPALKRDLRDLGVLLWNVTLKAPELRGQIWSLIWFTFRNNRRTIKHALYMGMLYSHLGPFSRYVTEVLGENIREIEADPNYENRWEMVQSNEDKDMISPLAHAAEAARPDDLKVHVSN